MSWHDCTHAQTQTHLSEDASSLSFVDTPTHDNAVVVGTLKVQLLQARVPKVACSCF